MHQEFSEKKGTHQKYFSRLGAQTRASDFSHIPAHFFSHMHTSFLHIKQTHSKANKGEGKKGQYTKEKENKENKPIYIF